MQPLIRLRRVTQPFLTSSFPKLWRCTQKMLYRIYPEKNVQIIELFIQKDINCSGTDSRGSLRRTKWIHKDQSPRDAQIMVVVRHFFIFFLRRDRGNKSCQICFSAAFVVAAYKLKKKNPLINSKTCQAEDFF